MHACLFSSENGAWSALTSALIDNIYQLPPDYTTSCITIDNVPAALMGNEPYFIGDFGNEILRCDLVGENLAVVDPLDVETCYDGVVVMPEENGRLGFAFVKANNLHLWLMKTGPDGYGRWEKRRVIDLETLFPILNLSPYLSGFVDAINCIVVTTDDALYTIELKTLLTRKVCKTEKPYSYCCLYSSFYIPGHNQANGMQIHHCAVLMLSGVLFPTKYLSKSIICRAEAHEKVSEKNSISSYLGRLTFFKSKFLFV
ncbi:hypothetical protein PVAP13_2KG076300 [Panicum virgatum]|uniref:F-box protein n=1 Tax=Panicum virgatum TaxID=38727 RepID=A0A8T0W2S8_PANVG|nr:hypothetical protein PVAP13_2KG076300 [Panicum virgatum]